LKLATAGLFVVYSTANYCASSLADEDVFTDKLEAEALCDDLNQQSKQMMPGTSVNYHVTTLDDFMRIFRDDALAEGHQ
jgi:hypothetical protein